MKTNSPAVTTSGQAGPDHASGLSRLPWRSGLLLLASGTVALEPLTTTWNTNSNYSFGWWIPVVCLVLLSERWPVRPARQVVGSFRFVPWLILWGFLFLVFRLAAEADPDWRPGLWILVGLYVASLFGWLWLEGGPVWVRFFAFPVCFLFLCLPWLFEIEYPLVQGLMRWNAMLVAHSLQGLGIFAEPEGNIIRLQNCKLGVEEACSGILSLQASLVMGCLLGDIYRLTIRRRFLLVGSSMCLALVGNYMRTFFLALMAFYSGSDAVPKWHDTAGYAILIFTAIGSWMAALGFAQGKAPDAPVGNPVPYDDEGAPERKTSLRFAAAVCGAVLLAEVVTQGWFGMREATLPRHPEWTVQLPTSSPSFKPFPLSDVTLEVLRCDKFVSGLWQSAQGWQWSTYWFQYEPKPYTKIVLGWHTPDNCLPSVGLIKDRDYPDFTAQINGIDLYVHPKKFQSNGIPVYVFWVVYANQGVAVSETETGLRSFSNKFGSHLREVWNGDRGVGVETMEVVLNGPQSYEDAKAGYLAELEAIIKPVK